MARKYYIKNKNKALLFTHFGYNNNVIKKTKGVTNEII